MALKGMNILLSVITATKNAITNGRGEMLVRCIESVSRLSVSHEHIICDGASNDGTLDLIHRSANNASLRVFSEPDSGIYQAFNKGIRRALGEWVYFLGSDDWIFSPEDLENTIEEARSASVEMVVSPVRHSTGSENFKGKGDCGNILIIKPYCHQGVLMTRGLVERLGFFNEEYGIASDFEMCLKAHLMNVQCLFLKKAYTCFCVEGGASANSDERHERLEISAKLLNVPESYHGCLYARQLLPFEIIFRLLVHKNEIIRQGARYAFARRVASILGMLDNTGGPKPLFVQINKKCH